MYLVFSQSPPALWIYKVVGALSFAPKRLLDRPPETPMIPPMNTANSSRLLLTLLGLPLLAGSLLISCGGDDSDGAGTGSSPAATTEVTIATEFFDEAKTKKKAEGPMSYGLKDGQWTWWYENGQIAVRGKLRADKPVGVWEEWHETGQKKSEIPWKAGKKEGVAKEWHPNGNLRSEGTFAAGVPVGIHSMWYPNGKIFQTQNYVDGQLDGPQVAFFDNGEKQREGTYAAGVQVGKATAYFPNGAVDHTGELVDGKRVGTWSFFHPTGEPLMEMTHVDGQIEGTVVRRFPNGNLQATLVYEKGLLQGPSEVLFVDGKLRSKGSYKDGARVGVWEDYNADGSQDPLRSGTYEAGVRVKDSAGEPIDTQQGAVPSAGAPGAASNEPDAGN